MKNACLEVKLFSQLTASSQYLLWLCRFSCTGRGRCSGRQEHPRQPSCRHHTAAATGCSPTLTATTPSPSPSYLHRAQPQCPQRMLQLRSGKHRLWKCWYVLMVPLREWQCWYPCVFSAAVCMSGHGLDPYHDAGSS